MLRKGSSNKSSIIYCYSGGFAEMKSEPSSPLCYKCSFRRNIPGDAHSECANPEAGGSLGIFALYTLMKTGKTDLLNIQGNAHGIAHGWFAWPLNFDPVWLENCDGFTPLDTAITVEQAAKS
jgi:hypothetical protein